MSDSKTITIEITNKILTPQEKKEKEKKEKKENSKEMLVTFTVSKAEQMITSTISSSINRYFSLSEDYIAENAYRNVMTTIGKTKSLVSTIVGGAKIGSVGGVAGGIAGGVIAFAAWGGTELLNNQKILSSYYQSLNSANVQTEFSRVRAGLVDNGRGTEN